MATLQNNLDTFTQGPSTQSEHETKKIKILFFTSSLGNGGAEMHLLRVINALDRQKFQLSVALAQSGGSYEANLAEGMTVYSFNPPEMPSSTLRMLRAIAPLRQLIQSNQPDIVCAVQDHANLAALWACKNLSNRPKLLLCAQNTPLAQYHRCLHPLDQFMRSLLVWLYPQADRIIALSHGVAQDLHRLIGDNLASIEVIYNAGMDASVKIMAKEALSSDERPPGPLLVACGRLHEQKGFFNLLDALVQVRQTIPAQLWIIGEGPQHSSLEQQIQRLNLTSAVRLLGFQKNPYKYIAVADVFVLSSLYEGFGNVIVEAMACGVPVIATNCTHGPAEILEQGKFGLLVPPADNTALAQGILQLLNHPSLRQQFVQRGLERSQEFHANAIANQYADLFTQILK